VHLKVPLPQKLEERHCEQRGLHIRNWRSCGNASGLLSRTTGNMAQDKVTVTDTPAEHDDTSWHLGSPVATALIGTNPLLSAGLMHTLSNTCFVVSEEMFDIEASFSLLAAAEPALLILDANRCSGRMAEAIRPLKAAHPTAKVVVCDIGVRCWGEWILSHYRWTRCPHRVARTYHARREHLTFGNGTLDG
jgi:hypothetical protein